MERKMADVDNDDSDDEEKGKKYHPFTATDVQKIRLEKLMANIVSGILFMTKTFD